MARQRNHYAVLNVAPDAEPVVIEAAYRALMKKYHPDQHPPQRANGPNAAEINAAFAILRNPQKRADYDSREWTRSQAIQLAQHQQAFPHIERRSNFFGWGGWLVALLLGGAIGIIANQSGRVSLPRAETAKAAALVDPDLRSQPNIAPVSSAELAQIRADAYLGNSDAGHAPAPTPPADNATANASIEPQASTPPDPQPPAPRRRAAASRDRNIPID